MISTDGKPVGATPKLNVELTPGRHELHLVNQDAGIDVRKTIRVRKGKTLELNLKLDEVIRRWRASFR